MRTSTTSTRPGSRPTTWSESELRDLCRVGRLAWQHASGNVRKARFTWRGHAYYATHTSFRLKIYTTAWEPVVSVFD
jgi:hypothetical protein